MYEYKIDIGSDDNLMPIKMSEYFSIHKNYQSKNANGEKYNNMYLTNKGIKH